MKLSHLLSKYSLGSDYTKKEKKQDKSSAKECNYGPFIVFSCVKCFEGLHARAVGLSSRRGRACPSLV